VERVLAGGAAGGWARLTGILGPITPSKPGRR
jgi:hypothetical protein